MTREDEDSPSVDDPALFGSRRRFLKTAAAVVVAPSIIPASALGADGSTPPSERVAMGCIGVGGQGSGDMWAFANDPRVQVVAVCDVDAARRDAAQKGIDAHYARRAPSGACKGCVATTDFRD
ncbi:MAG TPA: twin-arginine translocation signal domain-containing protein, partial [Sumerlaeia bacterium]|nr:twin-arginine translocation signal domain-containing protein [Sumerlaeia bacterium]